jgi:hypothetical protein
LFSLILLLFILMRKRERERERERERGSCCPGRQGWEKNVDHNLGSRKAVKDRKAAPRLLADDNCVTIVCALSN